MSGIYEHYVEWFFQSDLIVDENNLEYYSLLNNKEKNKLKMLSANIQF